MSQIDLIRAEIERRKEIYENAVDFARSSGQDECASININLANLCENLLSFLEQEEKPKRVRTLEKEFDGYNPIVVTLDKYVLEGIGVYRHNKVIIQIQGKED